MSLKVLHVAETVRGGIATYFNELHHLQVASFGERNIHYVIPSDHRQDIAGVPDESIIGFERSGRGPASLGRLVVATLKAVRERRPDIVHLHSTFAGMLLRPVLRALHPGVGIVYCPHGWAFARETSAASHLATRSLERLLAPLAHQIVCISRSEREAGLGAGIAAAKLALVHSGISVTRPAVPAASWNDPRIKVLFVGRLDRQKGYDLLIEAAGRMQDKIHVRMIGSAVVGEDQLPDIPANVEMLGWSSREEIEAQLDQADIAIVPSRWEGFGLVALEAMRARKAVVAFAVGALPEIIEDGVTGFLCSPVTADALAQSLERCAHARLADFGEAGYRRFAAMFVNEQMHRTLSAVYSRVRPGIDATAELTPQV